MEQPRHGWAGRRWRRIAADAGEIATTAILGCWLGGVLAGGAAILSVVDTLPFGPPVGAILTFGPYGRPAPVWHIDAMQADSHRHCVLRPAVMAAARGSMAVEQRRPGPVFQVHWSGGPTSNDAGNCGSDADLLLRLPAIQTLVDADAASRGWHFLGF